MANLNKVEIPVALDSLSRFDLSCDHITTGQFLQAQPVYYRHMVPHERIDLNALCTCRLAPLSVPTYGRLRINLRSFFVPFRLVFPNWDAFYLDVIGSNYDYSGLISQSPCVQNDNLVKYFRDVSMFGGVTLITEVSTANYDFTMVWSDNTTHNYVFTFAGRRVYKIIRSLGYTINWNVNDNTKYSALALLCYARVFCDWYSNSQYLDSADYLTLKKMFAFNNPNTQLNLSLTQLEALLSISYAVVYDGDYFVSAWENPTSPVNGQFSITTFNDVSSGGTGNTSVTNSTTTYGTPMMFQSGANATSIGTQYIHDVLKKFTDYARRNQLAGNLEVDRYLARFGVNLPAMNINRSTYVGAKSIDVNIGDVMSMADTNINGESNLGDYAGRGFAQDSKNWTFKTEEFGLFVVISSIIPSGGYYQGMDRNNMHLTKKDFFTPELDALAVQDIQKRELYVSDDGSFGTGAQYDGLFGLTGRYAEYKRPKSLVTGDFLIKSVFAGGDSWHLMRQFTDASFPNGIADVDHSLQFTRGIDFDSYNRIFQYQKSDVDKFYLSYHFDVATYSPMRSLFDTYDFENDGRKIHEDANGTKLN